MWEVLIKLLAIWGACSAAVLVACAVLWLVRGNIWTGSVPGLVSQRDWVVARLAALWNASGGAAALLAAVQVVQDHAVPLLVAYGLLGVGLAAGLTFVCTLLLQRQSDNRPQL